MSFKSSSFITNLLCSHGLFNIFVQSGGFGGPRTTETDCGNEKDLIKHAEDSRQHLAEDNGKRRNEDQIRANDQMRRNRIEI